LSGRPFVDEVAAHLQTRFVGRVHRHLAECGSTNDEAAGWARTGAPEGALVTAESQTKGRGRLGRVWHSPTKESLYFSLILRPRLAPHRLPPLTLIAGIAVAEAIEAEKAVVELKWPNDLLLGGQKVAGILTEMSCRGMAVEQVVLGIGVNLNMSGFPPELEAMATSLRRSTGREIDRARFTARLCSHLERLYQRFLAEGPAPLLPEWRRRATLFGRTVEVLSSEGRVCGIAESLDDEGALILRTDKGPIKIVAGEVETTRGDASVAGGGKDG
jgi:BirA family biotin operon repressor/biotin-[acetyl-CoA-carboxylase] ligase